jgi:hypothetical protein
VVTVDGVAGEVGREGEGVGMTAAGAAVTAGAGANSDRECADSEETPATGEGNLTSTPLMVRDGSVSPDCVLVSTGEDVGSGEGSAGTLPEAVEVGVVAERECSSAGEGETTAGCK